MILLYILGLLAALMILIPTNILPIFISWPLAMVVELLVVIAFNLRKKDTVFITKPVTNTLAKRGLFHPVMVSSAVACYFVGFLFVYQAMAKTGFDNLVMDFFNLFEGFSFSTHYELIIGLSLIIFAIFINSFKWLFSHFAESFSLRKRGCVYIIYFVISLVTLSSGIILVNVADFNKFVFAEFNLYFFLGIPALLALIDVIVSIAIAAKAKKKKKALLQGEASVDVEEACVAEEPVISEEIIESAEDRKFKKVNRKQQKIISKAVKKQTKNSDALNEEEVVTEETKEPSKKELKKLAKRTKKQDKRAAKQEKKQNKRRRKYNKEIDKKQDKLNKKLKKQNKNLEKMAKKAEKKKNKKAAASNEQNEAIKPSKKELKAQKKSMKKTQKTASEENTDAKTPSSTENLAEDIK